MLPVMPGPPDTDEELIDWLRLIRTPNIGPQTFWSLLARCGSAHDAIEAAPSLASRVRGGRALRITPRQDVEQELDRVARYGARVVPLGSKAYPPLLAEVDAPPPLLTAMGDLGIATPRTVGIVGARNASASGRKMAALLAEGLGTHGLTIASGLARGIDTQAHKASLATGTVAVMAGGIDHIYPRENEGLYREIAQHGAVVTEMPFGTEPVARYFPRRNRLISGMSAAVVVIEAAQRSGSLITARFAAEQGRDVFAVPGSPLDQRARGTNDLIRNGATLVQSAEDVMEAIDGRFAMPQPDLFTAAEPMQDNAAGGNVGSISEIDYAAVTELLSPSPVAIDDLARLSGIGINALSAIILELELAGRAVRHPGGTVSRP
jgi:DNA processing protein